MKVYTLSEEGAADLRVRCDFCGVEHRIKLHFFPSGKFVVEEKEGNCIIFQSREDEDVHTMNTSETKNVPHTERESRIVSRKNKESK